MLFQLSLRRLLSDGENKQQSFEFTLKQAFLI